jgi:hypothetical protein
MIIDFTTLHNYCITYLSSLNNFDSLLYDFSLNLFNTGLRAAELKEFKRWSVINELTLKCTLEKNSGTRLFNISDLTNNFWSNIQNNEDPYPIFSSSQALFYFNRFFPGLKIYHQNRSEKLNLFRHHKAKELKNLGKSDVEIQNYFCEKDIRNSNNYIYSQLTN